MIRTAVLLTCYGRPLLVRDAIASVLEQEPQDWRLYIMDDGSDDHTRDAIRDILWDQEVVVLTGDRPTQNTGTARIIWWQGEPHTQEERRAIIRYSATINIALNYLIGDEPYHAALCDDDYLLPGSLAGRADYLDAHPEAEVVFGRLRMVQFAVGGGRNTWQLMAAPVAGRRWLLPTGARVYDPREQRALAYYLGSAVDPDTSLPYVEEGFWLPGPMQYGRPCRIDHNQAMWRASCLRSPEWPMHADGVKREYWRENRDAAVGDAAFFSILGAERPFIGVDCWAATKRYHSYSEGVSDAEIRE